ncbi:MAG: TlpA disulfide reductase family protein [Chloroflexi bacterium]|nr:TlpA disulfide reductase family protein [Chloroflexota bacterium]MCY4247756.1 TlpA disulfide reductase family protein [Chloroflexota bacterium]
MSRSRRLAHWLAALICCGLALAIIVQAGLPQRSKIARGSSTAAVPAVGRPAPIFQLPGLTGETISLLRDGTAFTLLYFWSTTCAPCRKEMPALNDLYASEPLRILAVNMGESANRVRAWVDQLGLRYPALLDPALAVARAYQIRGLPSAFLIDAEYRIVRVYFGPVSIEQLRRDIAGVARHAQG